MSNSTAIWAGADLVGGNGTEQEREMAKEPTLPSMLVIGAMRFRAGTKIATVQEALDRVNDSYDKLQQIVWQVKTFKDRLPPDLRDKLAAF